MAKLWKGSRIGGTRYFRQGLKTRRLVENLCINQSEPLSPSQRSYPTHTWRGEGIYCPETVNKQACWFEDSRHNEGQRESTVWKWKSMALNLRRESNNQVWGQKKDFVVSNFFTSHWAFHRQRLQNKNHQKEGVRLKRGQGTQETGKLSRREVESIQIRAEQHNGGSRRKVCKKGEGGEAESQGWISWGFSLGLTVKIGSYSSTEECVEQISEGYTEDWAN